MYSALYGDAALKLKTVLSSSGCDFMLFFKNW